MIYVIKEAFYVDLNLLQRIRRELDTDLDPGSFEHYAFYNPSLARIEMHLVSNLAQVVHVADQAFAFAPGDGIHTENSYKYTVDGFGDLAARAGFRQQAVWCDEHKLFSVQLLQNRPAARQPES